MDFSKLVVGTDVYNVADAVARKKLSDVAELKQLVEELSKKIDGKVQPSYVGMTIIDEVCDSIEKVKAIYGQDTEWKRETDVTIVASGNTFKVGETGGSATVTLENKHIPKHSHSIPALSGSTNWTGTHQHDLGFANGWNQSSGGDWGMAWTYGASTTTGVMIKNNGNHAHSVTTNASTTGEAGSSEAFNIMNPYTVKNVWTRTA